MSVSFLGSQAVQGGAVSSSRPVQVTAGASNAKGSYGTAHFASTTHPASWALVTIPRFAAAADAFVDIALGSAAAEQVIIANLTLSQNSATSPAAANYLFPLHIPAGSRVSSRAQSSAGSTLIIDVQVTLFAPMFGGEKGLEQVETCGANTGTSLGTSVDPGGSSSTKGTPAQLIASTSFPYKWVCVSINHTNVLTNTTSWTVDIMVGAGGSEVVVVPDLAIHGGTVGDTNPAIGLCFPCSIPAGTRVSARCQCNVIAASERLLEVVLHGVG